MWRWVDQWVGLHRTTLHFTALHYTALLFTALRWTAVRAGQCAVTNQGAIKDQWVVNRNTVSCKEPWLHRPPASGAECNRQGGSFGFWFDVGLCWLWWEFYPGFQLVWILCSVELLLEFVKFNRENLPTESEEWISGLLKSYQITVILGQIPCPRWSVQNQNKISLTAARVSG